MDRSVVTVQLCKDYIKGVRGDSEDALILFLLEAAKRSADDHMGNDFLDDEGNELPVPGPVERWVLQQVVRDYELKPQGLQIESVNNLGMVNWGNRDYSDITPYRAARYWL